MSEKKKLEVRCPCCDATLTLDAASGEVLFSKQAARKSVSFEDAVREVEKRRETASERFDQAFEREKGRKELIDMKFREAMERSDELEMPVRDIDLD
jgi:wobble nucleotide-excising tRNase